MASSVEAIQKILQETVAPGISDIKVDLAGMKSDIKALQSEIKRLDDKVDNGFARLDIKIDSLRNETLSEIHRLDDKMDNGFKRLDEKIDLALEIRERLAALEAKISVH